MEAEGWVQLHDATTLGGFERHAGWQLADSPGIGGDVTKLVPKVAREPQPGALLCETGPAELAAKYPHGDAHVRLEFMLPRGGSAELLLQGRYGITLCDTIGSVASPDSCGAIVCGTQRVAPQTQAYERAGEWQSLDVWFEAPLVLSDGTRPRKARIARVELNHRVEINQGKRIDDPKRWLIHEDVDVEAEDERSEAPLVLRTQGPFAIRRFEIRVPEKDPAPQRPIRTFTGPTLRHELPETLMNGSTRLSCRLSQGGDAVLEIGGAAIRHNRSNPEKKEKSGSIAGKAKVESLLIPLDDTWFDLEVQRLSKTVTVRVNGIRVAEAAVAEMAQDGKVVLVLRDAGTVVGLR